MSQAWELIQTVLPFHAITFRSGAAPRQNPRAPAGLAVLDACAHTLLYELKMEGLATGLDVHMEVRCPCPTKPQLGTVPLVCVSGARASYGPEQGRQPCRLQPRIHLCDSKVGFARTCFVRLVGRATEQQ